MNVRKTLHIALVVIVLPLLSCTSNLVLKDDYTSVDAVIQDSIELGVPGIAVCYGNRLSYECAEGGFTDLTAGVAALSTSSFRTASITKTFTAAVVYKLSEQGFLDINDKFTDYVRSELVDQIPHIRQVKIIDLLEHRSGIFNFTNSSDFEKMLFEPGRSTDLSLPPHDFLAYAIDERNKPSFLPGEGREYSNTGYILLGLLIEEVTGLSYEMALDDYIFEPCDMSDTFLEGATQRSSNMVSYTYVNRWDRLFNKQFGLGNGILKGHKPINANNLYDVSTGRENFNGWPWAAGAISSTSVDLAKFFQCYLNHDFQTVADPETLSAYQTYGWRGLSTGIDALMMYDVADEFFYVVLVNVSNGAIDSNDIYLKLRDVLNR